MESLVRFMPPILAAVMTFLVNTDFVTSPAGNAHGWKIIGLILPALWLTGIGPHNLIAKGGFIMRLLRIPSTRQRVALMGLGWLSLFLICALLLDSSWVPNVFLEKLVYGLAHAGLISALGVYAFLAITPE